MSRITTLVKFTCLTVFLLTLSLKVQTMDLGTGLRAEFDDEVRFEHDGEDRVFYVVKPDNYDAGVEHDKTFPVAIMIHGFKSRAL